MAFIIGTIICTLFVYFPRTMTVIAVALGWMIHSSAQEEARQVRAVEVTAAFAPHQCGSYQPMLVRFHNGSERVVKEIDGFYVRGLQPGNIKPDYGTNYGTLSNPGMSKLLAPGDTWQTCVRLPPPLIEEPVAINQIVWDGGIGTVAVDGKQRADGRHITFMTVEEAKKYM